jgi:hypothetical protein
LGGTYTADALEKSRGWLTAIDAATGQTRWKYSSERPMLAAVTTTSAELIFTGELTGDFLVLDARDGKVLYRFNCGGPLNGGIISYAVNGRQYIAVNSGNATGLRARGQRLGDRAAFRVARKQTIGGKIPCETLNSSSPVYSGLRCSAGNACPRSKTINNDRPIPRRNDKLRRRVSNRPTTLISAASTS